MSVSFWMDESSKVIKKDIVIIGGGIAGFSAAYWLQKRDPKMEIALLEKYQFGDGATGRNAGFVTCGSVEHFNRLCEKHGAEEALEIWRFSEENLRLLKEEIIKDDGRSLLFEEKGSFSLASQKNEFNELRETARIMDKMGVDIETLNSREIKNRLGAHKFYGGIKYVRDASIHPLKLLQRIKNILKENSRIQFYENHEVFKIKSYSENKLIFTRNGVFEAPIVILGTNGYSPLLDDFFVHKIFPTRGQILATESLPHFMEGPCYANFVLDYFRQLPTGELLIGGFRQLQKDVEKGYSDETTNIIQDALKNFIGEHIPNAKNAEITHRWSGVMGFSFDGMPMVGSLPHDSQVFFLGGFTAHGLGLAFHCAKALSDSLFGNPIPSFISGKRF